MPERYFTVPPKPKPRYQDDLCAVAWACPACNAKPGEPCTAPTDDGRRNVRWLHHARTDKLADQG